MSPSYLQPVESLGVALLERLVSTDKELCKILSSEARDFTQNWNSEKNPKRSIISDNFHGIRGWVSVKKFHDGFH